MSNASAATPNTQAPVDRATVERLFAGRLLSIARFRCPPMDERWSHENWIGDRPHVVFPHLPVTIRQRGRRPAVADPTQVVLYRTGEHYERERLSPDGDRSTFLTIERDADPGLADAIGSSQATVDARDVLLVRILAASCRGVDYDALQIEEQGLWIVGRVLDSARSAEAWRLRARTTVSRRVTERAHEQAVLDVQRYLALNTRATDTLADIGVAVGVSPFHLARIFRRATGLSLHGYREQLRLRSSLEQLADTDVNLTALAIELGFASHSHFDDRFRRTFGRSPSTIRAILRLGRAKTSTLTEALAAPPH